MFGWADHRLRAAHSRSCLCDDLNTRQAGTVALGAYSVEVVNSGTTVADAEMTAWNACARRNVLLAIGARHGRKLG